MRTFILERRRERTDALDTIACPVLVSFGRKDQIILEAMAHHIVARVPQARLSLYDDVGHSPFFEDTARFNAELNAFVAACVAGGGV